MGMADILILEDDFDLAAQWEVAFKANGHNVHHAANAVEAVEIARRYTLDAAVLDIFIRRTSRSEDSDGGGFSALSHLTKGRAASGLPVVVFVTGVTPRAPGDFDPLESARKMGADLALRKPVDAADLVARVEEAMRAAPGATPAA